MTDRRTVPAFGVCAVLLCTWIYRGIILSGYPFFPSSFLAAPVEWRVPESVLRDFQNYILLWARLPHGDATTALETVGWIPHWFGRVVQNQYQFAWPIQVGIASALALSLFERDRRERLRWLGRTMILLIPLRLYSAMVCHRAGRSLLRAAGVVVCHRSGFGMDFAARAGRLDRVWDNSLPLCHSDR